MADRTSATTSTFPPVERDPANDDAEIKWDIKWEVWFAAFGAVLGALHALSVSKEQVDSLHAVGQIVTEIFIFGGLGFLVREVFRSRITFHRFLVQNNVDRKRIINTEEDTATELRRLCSRAEKSIEIKEGIYETIGNAFSHDNEMVRRFLMGSIGESLQPLTIARDKLVARGDIFTGSLYRNFWDELLAEQRRRGKKRPLKVYLSHASSISVFEDQGQTDVLVRQGEFWRAGGVVRRVLIRSPQSDESLERYEAVKARMRSFNADAEVLDLNESEAKSSEAYAMDFLLVEIDGQPYVLEWEWIKSAKEQFGRVSATHIHLTRGGCSPFYRYWRLILQGLSQKMSERDFSDWFIRGR